MVDVSRRLGRLSPRPVVRGIKKRWKQWKAWGKMARRLLPFVAKRRHRLLLAMAFGVAYTLVGLAQPWTMKLILDSVILGHPLPGFLQPVLGFVSEDRLLLLNILALSIVLLALASGLLYYYQQLLAAQVGQRAVADVRLELYRHLQRLSFSFHDRRRTGDMLARLTSDIRFLRDIFISLPISLGAELSLLIGMLVVMAVMDPALTLVASISVPAIALLLRTYQKPMRNAMRRQRDREGDIATTAAEVLGAIKVVQSFRREDLEAERFNTSNKRSLRTGLKATRLEAKFRWYAEVTVAVVTALVIGLAARRVLVGSLLPGDLIVFVTYLRKFNRPLRRVSRMAERSTRGVAAGERVFEMMEMTPEVRDRKNARPAKRFLGEIVFDRVSFKHRVGPRVLHRLNLSIGAGERVALVGTTGSGKSTLVSLIPRFYEPTRGRVLIDGVDIRRLTLGSIRDQIAIVFQEPVLFAASVAENIAYGKPDATPAEIERAANRAGIGQVIESLSEGYETVLGERGGTLSGGQRQCVTIARAMIRDARIVILDEPLTGLDSESSAMVLAALERLMKARTVIMISHQLGTLRSADRIVVLEGGRIVESGTHTDLLSQTSTYGRLTKIQKEAMAS